MIETTVSQRRELDSERQRNETEDQRKAREASILSLHIFVAYHYDVYHREMSPAAQLFRLRYRRSFGHFTAPFAKNSFKTSLNTMSTPTRMHTTTRFVSVTCKLLNGPSKILVKNRINARKRNGSAKRRSYVRLPPQPA